MKKRFKATAVMFYRRRNKSWTGCARKVDIFKKIEITIEWYNQNQRVEIPGKYNENLVYSMQQNKRNITSKFFDRIPLMDGQAEQRSMVRNQFAVSSKEPWSLPSCKNKAQ